MTIDDFNKYISKKELTTNDEFHAYSRMANKLDLVKYLSEEYVKENFSYSYQDIMTFIAITGFSLEAGLEVIKDFEKMGGIDIEQAIKLASMGYIRPN